MNRMILKNSGVLLAWGLLVAAYFWEAVSLPVLLGERDLSSFFFPAVKCWVEAVQRGEFPLWNPYSFAGQPLFASLQPGVLYPPNVLLFFLPLFAGFNLTIVLHFFLSGWFVYLLSRELETSRQAGFLAALGFALGGFLLSLHSVLSSLQSASWAPLVLCFLLRALKKASWKYVLLTALIVLVQFLGGGIEIFLLTLALVALIALFPRLWLSGGGWPGRPWRLKSLALIIVLFLGLGAVQILPFWEMVRESSRGGGFSYGQATIWSLTPQDLWYLFFPDFFWRGMDYYFQDQNWLKSIYLGFLPLGLLFLYFRYGEGKRIGWAGLVLGSLVLALGRNTPVYEVLFRTVPGVSLIRYPVKFFFLTHLFICLLAGFGWDSLVKKLQALGGEPWKGPKTAALVLALVLAFMLLAAALFYPDLLAYLNTHYPLSSERPWSGNLHNFFRFTVAALLMLLVFAFLTDRKLSLAWGGRGLIFLLAADLFLGNWGHYRVFDREAYLKSSPNLEIIRQDPTFFRVYAHPLVLKALVPAADREWMHSDFHQERFYLDYPAVQHVFNAFGFPVLVFKPIKDLLVLFETSPTPGATDVLRLLNVKYLLWPDPIAGAGARLIREMGLHQYVERGGRPDPARPESLRAGRPRLYGMPDTLPRAGLISQARVVKSERERGDLIKSRGFDPTRTVLLEEPPIFPGRPAGNLPRQDEVRWVAYRNNHLALQAACSGPRLLLLSEADYPGWRARVDGRPEKIYRANHAFRAVPLDPGIHEVRFDYQPGSFYWGLGISLVTLGGVILGGLFLLLRPKGNRIQEEIAPGIG
ncbi:MAG: YfhO family protein [Deltaproteobacteria bacterium]|nr:YfhO family protein [Deltaproteobacteria bacterium]